MPKPARLPFLAAIVSMLPFLIWLPKFHELYWFQDDWELLNGWAKLGTAAWVAQPMGENFAPAFKLLWIAAIHLTGGGYFGMIALLWITHLAILLLFAMVLSRCDFSEAASAIAVAVLGLSWTNIEMLGWATQWSALLCTLCLLIAWVALIFEMRWLVMVAILIGGAMFARGILAGAVLGIFLLLGSRHRRFAAVLIALTLVLLIPYAMLKTTDPELRRVDPSHLGAMAAWTRNYLLLNPIYLLFSYPRKIVDARALWIFGALKMIVLGAGLIIANRTQRRVLWTLVIFDIATAVLISSGRYNTGAAGEISSRYQYESLLCFGPFLGLSMARLPRPLMLAAALALIIGITIPWGRHLDRWAYERGMEVREAVQNTPASQRFGLPSITAGRARQLIEKYNLH